MATTKGSSVSGTVSAVCVSAEKGTKKQNVGSAALRENWGIVGDAHGGGSRQVSLLADESIQTIRAKGLAVGFGDFGENIVTRGIDLKALPIGTELSIGETGVLQITEIGKECVSRCAIYDAVGDCVMPREGVFAKVVRGGTINTGDLVSVLRMPETRKVP